MSWCRSGGDIQSSKHTLNDVNIVGLKVYMWRWPFGKASTHLMVGQISPGFWDCIYLCVHRWFLKWMWQHSVEREVQDHTEAYKVQLGKKWITVINVRCRSMTLVLETDILYFPITRCFHHQRLSYMPPLLSFMYSFTHPSQPPFSNYEHLLWATTVPGSRSYQRARGKWSLLSQA